MERFNVHGVVNIVLIKDGKILLARRMNTGWNDGMYEIPSGHIDGQESIKTATCREAKEEIGIEISPGDLEFLHVMHRKSGDKEKVEFFFKTDIWQGEPKISEPDKCDDLNWFGLDNLPENLIPKVASAIECILQEKKYSEFGW
jgi:8-oxo-dGTP diphosphatase